MKVLNRLVLCCCAAAALLAGVAGAEARAAPGDSTTDLTELSIEELMNVEVTSVSKKPEKLSEAAAAVYVITQEDIRRSGATSIPEALRMAPGLHVARIDANKWAITSRGFNGEFANKLLVLIDGRTVYTPLFAGVYWDVQDTMLEDIDRIEIIRGPGATMWGANAVNGVINIITKSARDTQGGLVSGGAGSEERGFGGVRYGGTLGDSAWYRVYAKYFNRDDSVDSSGDRTSDEWDMLRGGFRIDWDVSESDSLTFQGDIYDGDLRETVDVAFLTPPALLALDKSFDVTGANVLARWSHVFSDTSDMSMQVYYDRAERDKFQLDEVRDTFDLDFQHRFVLGDRHEIVWGLGYRYTADDLDGSFTISLDPDSRHDDLVTAFVQDEITLVDERLKLTVGSKFEHNDYTGFEIQPSVRLLSTPHERHTLWAAVSRAVRTPARTNDDMRINFLVFPGTDGSTNVMTILGDDDFESEELTAYELGYRVQPVENVYLDIAAFYNVYDDLLTQEPGIPFFELTPAPPHMVIPMYFDNMMDGETYGAEVAVNWNVTESWRVAAGFTCIEMDLDSDSSSGDTLADETERSSPQHQFHIRSYLNLPHNVQFDTALYYVDSLPAQDVSSYVRLDTRLGWRPTENLELSVGLQNLLDTEHDEYGLMEGAHPTEAERSVYGKVTWTF